MTQQISSAEHNRRRPIVWHIWQKKVNIKGDCAEIRIDAHTDIYITERRMSEILLRSHIPRSHTQLGCCFAGRLGDGGEWERDGGEEWGGRTERGERELLFHQVTHTHTHTHTHTDSHSACSPPNHENMKILIFLLSFCLSSRPAVVTEDSRSLLSRYERNVFGVCSIMWR